EIDERTLEVSQMVRARTTVFIVLPALVLLLRGGASNATDNQPLKGLDAYISKALKDWDVPGLAIAVLKDDVMVHSKGYGVRKLGESTPVNDRTMFPIRSASHALPPLSP